MLNELTVKDWLSLVPGWIGMALSIPLAIFTINKEVRDRRSRKPRYTANFERMIVPAMWKITISFDDDRDYPFALDELRVLSPRGWFLTPYVSQAMPTDEMVAKAKDRLVNFREDPIPEKQRGGMNCFLVAVRDGRLAEPDEVTIPIYLKLHLRGRKLQDRERRVGLPITRTLMA